MIQKTSIISSKVWNTYLIWAIYFKPLVNMRKSPIWVGSGNDFSKLLLRLKQSPAILQKLEIWIIIERIASGYINWNSKSWETWKKKQIQGPLISFLSCQWNLIKTFQIEAIVALITKMALIFSWDLLNGQK